MAELIDRNILDREKDIIEAPCPYFGECGGCKYQDVDYAAQLAGKTAILKRHLRPFLSQEEFEKISISPAEHTFRYRNKMEFTFSEVERELVLGLHKPGSFAKVIDLEDCLISPEPFKDVMELARSSAKESGLRTYNPRNKKGFWRYLTLRYSWYEDAVMAVIVTKPGNREAVEDMAKKIKDECAKVKSVYWGVNDKLSDVASPDELILLQGEEYINEKIGNIKLRVFPFNFLQPNIPKASLIYSNMASFLPEGESLKLLDLYCGIGSIGLYLAADSKAVEELVGVEIDESNVESASQNGKENNIANASFVAANIENQLKADDMFFQRFDADVIILDPPRAGMHKKVYKALIASGVKYIFYLSCNIKSLARDLQEIAERAPEYKVRHASGYDMFAQTPHFETLVILEKAD